MAQKIDGATQADFAKFFTINWNVEMVAMGTASNVERIAKAARYHSQEWGKAKNKRTSWE